jgi:hypothetical protein
MKWSARVGRGLWPMAVILLPALVIFWQIVFAGRVLFWGAPLLQFVPWYEAVRGAVQSGELPLWNPLVGAGAPLLANYQSAAFYPPNWLHLVLDPARSTSLLMIIHVLWAGLGMWLYAKMIGLHPVARLVSALSFALSGYLVSRLGFPSIGSTFPWAPWLLLATERLLGRPGLRGAGFLGLVLGLELLAGHAQTAFYISLMLASYFVVRAWPHARPTSQGDRRSLAVVGWFGAAVLLGIALAAVQLVPTAELQLVSQRAGGVEWDFAMTYSLWPWRVISFLAPRFFGHPATGNYWGYCCNYWEDNGYIGVLGLVLGLAAVVSWIRWRLRRNRPTLLISQIPLANRIVPFFGALAFTSLLLAFGIHTPIYPAVFKYAPGFGQFQAPARLLCLWTVAMSVLAGVGTDLWRPTLGVRRLGRYVIATGLALLIAAIAASGFLSDRTVTFRLGTAQLGISAALIGLLAVSRPRESERPQSLRWSAAVLLFVAADLVWANWGANPTAEPWLYTRPTESARRLREAAASGRAFFPDADEYAVTFDDYLSFHTFAPTSDDISPNQVPTDRWFGMREALIPNVGILDGLPSLNNFDPLRPARYELLVDAINTASGRDGIRLLEMAGVSLLVAAKDSTLQLEEVHTNSDVGIYRIPEPLPRAYVVHQAIPVSDSASAHAAVTALQFDPHTEVVLETSIPVTNSQLPMTPVALSTTRGSATMHVSLPDDGFLVLLDTYYPGWSATIDGEPVEIMPANLAFRAVSVPAGDHLVEFVYRPLAVRYGVVISLSAILFLGWVVISKSSDYRRKAEDGSAQKDREC